jgi:hypothetical protein
MFKLMNSGVHTVRSHLPALKVISGWTDMVGCSEEAKVAYDGGIGRAA